MIKKKRYSHEFKLQAARLVVESGYTYKEVAQRLRTTEWSIRQWVTKFCETGQLSPDGITGLEAHEFCAMKKEVKRLRLENEILKKAALG